MGELRLGAPAALLHPVGDGEQVEVRALGGAHGAQGRVVSTEDPHSLDLLDPEAEPVDGFAALDGQPQVALVAGVLEHGPGRGQPPARPRRLRRGVSQHVPGDVG